MRQSAISRETTIVSLDAANIRLRYVVKQKPERVSSVIAFPANRTKQKEH